MLSQYDSSDTTNTNDLFDSIDNTQQQTSTTTVPSSSPSPILTQQSTNVYQQQQPQIQVQIQQPQQQQQNQPRLAYLSQTRAQLSTYQTPNLQRIQTMPSTSTIVRPANVISNGVQQQPTVYTQQQMINRPLYQRMPTTAQQPTIIRQQYSTAMINVNQNVPQMGIVKASDPNNNNVFVTNSQQQQQSTLVGLPQTVTQTATIQTNKSMPTILPSIQSQQLHQFANPQQIPTQSYNTQQMRVQTQMIDQTPTNFLITTQQQPNHTIVQQQTTAASSSTSAAAAAPSTTNTNQHTEIQRKQFIQKQLVLLLHAHKCQQRERQSLTMDQSRSNPCTLPHCNTMKSVLQHMTKCNDHKTCPVAHCVTSRQIILHWKQCNNAQCPICQPLKTPSNLARIHQSASAPITTTTLSSSVPTTATATTADAVIASTSATNVSSATILTTATERPITKEWQRRVTSEMRNHLVQKIITALIPITETGAVRDKRIINLANYARRVENETFDVANNQEEYFHKLAEKIYKIQKELEDRREKKRLQDMQIAAQISSTNDLNNRMQPTMDSLAGDHGPPNRTAPSVDYLLSGTNRTVSSNGTFTVTNVPPNDSLSFLLNGDSTTTTTTTTTTATSHDGMNQIKTELISPKIKKEEHSTSLVKSSNEDIKPKIPQIDATSKQLPKQPIQFAADKLRTHLEPVIHKMIACEDSHPFRQPVDPVALNIPDYPTIVKHPMDISTMHHKLLHGEYKNPLQFCDDAWLMFNNAWAYNKKTTRVYKMCTKLSEVFADAIDPIMQTLGYCCGRQYVYLPQVMFCYGNQLCCQIPRDGAYYCYNNPEPSRFNLSGDKYTFCSKCFDSVKNDSIFVGDDPAQTLVEIPKQAFLAMKNDIQEPEAMIDCIVCTRRWHQVCALHLDQIWPEGFICNTCIQEYNIKRKPNRYTSFKLTETDLARVLEKRVNDFLRNEGCQTGRVSIRILAASDKVCEVKPRLKKYYANQVPDGYPYRTKAVFAFQEIEGVDVVLFGMHVQEYDGRCHAPNARRVYVSYLDSVHFFRPKIYRTEVYHEILIGYLDYAKKLGYVYAHIWACPPSEGDDYIFHCHPVEQRVPKPKRLQDWYKKMLDRAIVERVVIDYKDVMKDCQDNQVQSALQIPYFEGDFWSNIIEESIKELDQEEEDRRKQEVEAARAMEDGGFDDPIEAEDPTDISDKRKSANTHKKKNLKKTTASQRKVAKKQMSNCTDLISKIFSTMEKHKEAFFVIRLRNPMAPCPAVNDTDALIQCDLMDTRDAFLNFSRDKHYEFSSLRRAKFSTLALLYELHTSTSDKFTYNCNTCRQQCEIRYHCTVCDDFDLCEKCYNIEPKHEHRMERSVPSIVDVSHDGEHNSLNSNDKSLTSPQLQRQQSMQRCIEALLHAVNCRNANCMNRSCFRYKRVIQHTKECKGKNSQCNVCKQVIFLCWYHAKSCNEQNCQVPFCTNLKSKIQKQRATSLQTDRRRMQAMMQRTIAMQSQQQPQQQQSQSQIQPVTINTSIPTSNSFDSSGKPAPVTLIRAPQQGPWPNQTYITVAQKPNTGKPMQQTPNQLSVLIGRVKQDPSSLDDQQQQQQQSQQRSDMNDSKQIILQTLMHKTPVNRSPSTTTFVQQTNQPQQWHTQINPPPNYTTATRPRHPTIIQQQQQQPSTGHTLITPIRPNSATPQPTYIARASSTPNLTRIPLNVTLARTSQFSSQPQQQQQQPPQDPSPR